MAKRKQKETTVKNTVEVVEQLPEVQEVTAPVEEVTQVVEEVVKQEKIDISTIGEAIQNIGIFTDGYDISFETSNILEAAMKLHGQGKTTADHMTNMILTLETNTETAVEEKLDAYGKLFHDTYAAISKLGYDPMVVFNEYVGTIDVVKKKRPTRADYSKAKV